MKHRICLCLIICVLVGLVNTTGFAQSRRQTAPPGNTKKNKRPEPVPTTEPVPSDIMGKPGDGDTVTVQSELVNVEVTVIDKNTKQPVPKLKRERFAVFEDGVRQDISHFSTPEAPITVTLVVEFSKLTEIFGLYGSQGQRQGMAEVILPTAKFLSQFIKPQDYVSVIAYDMRPTPLTDFTNDPARIQQVIRLLLLNHPAFTETNMFDALKLTLVGGTADNVVLDNAKERTAEYGGMIAIQGNRRRAVLLVASGLDTFSKINLDQARKIERSAGIPIYIIGTGNLFMKQFGDKMDPGKGTNISGIPIDRMTFLQAENTLKTFAKDTGGAYFPITFPEEVDGTLESLNTLMRSQYSLAFKPAAAHDGKPHKIVVKFDANGDGVFDEKEDKQYVLQYRQSYIAPKDAADPSTGSGQVKKK